MSERIRSIKPEWLDDEKMSRASPEARVLSVALICMADDYGRGRFDVAKVAVRVFPPSGDSPDDVVKSLETLRRASCELSAEEFGYFRTYRVRGQTYYEITNWEEHQKVQHPSKTGQMPPPPDGEGCSRDSPETLMRDSCESHSRARGRDPGPGPGPGPEGVQGEGPTLDGIRDDDRETVCPLDLADRWTGYDEMTLALKVSRGAVDATVAEFVSYWTIGKGSGKKRRQWARMLRQRVVEQAPLEEAKLSGAKDPSRSGPAGRALAVIRTIKAEP